jgi:hypothetical protein
MAVAGTLWQDCQCPDKSRILYGKGDSMITLKVHGHYDKSKVGYVRFKGYLTKRNYQNAMKRLHIIQGDYLVLASGPNVPSIIVWDQRGQPVEILS